MIRDIPVVTVALIMTRDIVLFISDPRHSYIALFRIRDVVSHVSVNEGYRYLFILQATTEAAKARQSHSQFKDIARCRRFPAVG